MALTTITYACGHTTEAQMYGKHEDRARALAAMANHDCAACRAAGSDLTGSEKQVAWAMDIRAKQMPKALAAHAEWSGKLSASPAPEAAKAHVQAALDAALAEIIERKSAKAWIENSDASVGIYAAMVAAMKTAPKA